MKIKSQNEFNNIASKYIKKNNTNKLFMLARDYDSKYNLEKIEDYYISIKDSFNLCELISLSLEYLDLDNLFNKIINTNDINFIKSIENNIVINGIIDPKYLKKLKDYKSN